jgi:3-oxoacyl-[acyl-carrier protein] reductase
MLTPLKRVATFRDMAATIVNLVVSNRLVTGDIVIVDGGFANSS